MRSARLLFRVALSVVLLGILCWVVDVRAVWAVLRSARPAPLSVGLGLFLAACAVSSATWMFLLAPLDAACTYANAIALNLIGFFINNFVPGAVGGDVWRAWAYSRQSALGSGGTARGAARLRFGGSVVSVGMERCCAFMSLILLAWCALPFCNAPLRNVTLDLGGGRTVSAIPATACMLGALTLLTAVAITMWRPLTDWLGTRLRHAPPDAWWNRADAHDVLDSLARYRRHGPLLVLATLFSTLSPLVESFAYWQLGCALGIGVGPLPYMILTPVVRITNHFPLTMNGAGVQDAAMVWVMASLGISAPQALALSLSFHAAKICVSLLGLPLYIAMPLRRNSEETS